MKFCTKCGKELMDEAVVCPACGNMVAEENAPQTVSNDQVSVGLCVLSAFIPLFGIIYWALKYKETPKRAKACGITAIVAWVVSFVFGFVAGFVGALAAL